MVRIAVEHEAELLERRLAILTPVVLDLGQSKTEADEISLGQPAALDQLLDEPRQIAPPLGLGVEAIERLRRVPVPGRDLEHPLVGGDGVLGALERGLRQLTELQAQALFGRRILRQLGPADEDLVEGLVVARVAMNVFEGTRARRRRRARDRAPAAGTRPPSPDRPGAGPRPRSSGRGGA